MASGGKADVHGSSSGRTDIETSGGTLLLTLKTSRSTRRTPACERSGLQRALAKPCWCCIAYVERRDAARKRYAGKMMWEAWETPPLCAAVIMHFFSCGAGAT